MRRLALLLAALLLAGCPPQLGDDDTGDDDDAASGCPEQQEWLSDGDPGQLDVPGTVGGDWSCNNEEPEDPVEGAVGTVEAQVLDLGDACPGPAASVALWLDGAPAGDPDLELMSSSSGVVAFDAEPCTPLAARTSTDFEPPETYPALQTSLAALPDHTLSDRLMSIAYSTYNLLPLTVGVEPEPGRSMVFARVVDCAGEPAADAELSLGSIDVETGCAAESTEGAIRYLRDGDPDQDQLWTDELGWALALNLPPGASQELLAWGRPADEADCLARPDGTPTWSSRNPELCLVARAELHLEPDAATVVDVAARPLPPACY